MPSHVKRDYLAFLGRIAPEKAVDRAIHIAHRCGIPLKIAAKVDNADRDYFEAQIRPLLDSPLIEYLGEYPPERFVYVSCGLESFVSDAARLTSHGKLRLGALTAFNLLPFTDHVETVARFERVSRTFSPPPAESH